MPSIPRFQASALEHSLDLDRVCVERSIECPAEVREVAQTLGSPDSAFYEIGLPKPGKQQNFRGVSVAGWGFATGIGLTRATFR